MISFVVIAAFWKGNADLMALFRGIDSQVIVMNLLSAGLVVLLPFTMQGISDPQVSNLPLPTALYAVNVALVMITQRLVFQVGCNRGLLDREYSRREQRAWWIDTLVAASVFLLAIPVAFLARPQWAWCMWILLAILAPISGRWVERVSAEEQAEALPMVADED